MRSSGLRASREPKSSSTDFHEVTKRISSRDRRICRAASARDLRSLGRSILDPKILILDEATSALDPDSEAIVNENIRRIASGRTVIVISHRLSSLVNSDAILVLERGKVAAVGRHEELLESCDIYSGLWHQQNRHVSLRAAPASFRCGEAPVPSEAVPAAVRQFQSEIDAIRHGDEPLSVARHCFRPRRRSWSRARSSLAIARVDRVISSTGGKIVSVDAPLVFQALDPSIVKSIDVREGEVVEQGRQLATLDPTFAAADVNQLQQQIDSLNAQIAREEAELARTDLVFSPSEDPSLQKYEKLQKELFDQRAAQYSAQLESFDQKIALTQATIDKYENDEKRYKERLGVASEVEDMRSTLAQHGNELRLNVLGSMDTKLEALRNMEFGHNSLVEARHQMDGLKADRAAFIEQWFSQISQDLITARNSRDGARAQLEKATKHQDLVRLTAPERAMVLSLAKLSVGSVLKEGDTLMTLTPMSAPLEAEAQSRLAGMSASFDRAIR